MVLSQTVENYTLCDVTSRRGDIIVYKRSSITISYWWPPTTYIYTTCCSTGINYYRSVFCERLNLRIFRFPFRPLWWLYNMYTQLIICLARYFSIISKRNNTYYCDSRIYLCIYQPKPFRTCIARITYILYMCVPVYTYV